MRAADLTVARSISGEVVQNREGADMKKYLLIPLVAVLLVALLSGCGGGKAAAAPNPAGQTFIRSNEADNSSTITFNADGTCMLMEVDTAKTARNPGTYSIEGEKLLITFGPGETARAGKVLELKWNGVHFNDPDGSYWSTLSR